MYLLALAISAINIPELCFDYPYIPYIAGDNSGYVTALEALHRTSSMQT